MNSETMDFFYVNKRPGLPTVQKLSSLDAAETRPTLTSPSDGQHRRNRLLFGPRYYKNNWLFTISGFKQALEREARPAPHGLFC